MNRSQPLVSQSVRRVDARAAALRNRYILDHADRLFLGALDPDGSLWELAPTTPAFI